MRRTSITPVFVDLIPDRLDEGVLFICERYKIAIHRCCCGCGEEVVTPLSPTDWAIKTSGNTVSLSPSIGNWKFACKSHYWISNNRVLWAKTYSVAQIDKIKKRDKADKEAYLASVNMEKDLKAKRSSLFVKLWNALFSWWKS